LAGETKGVTCRAPGRVNLIGEHTDYNLGYVLPIALDLACFTTRTPNADGLLRAYSEDLGQERVWKLDEIGALRPAGDWGDYVAGVAQQLHKAGYAIEPLNLRIHSTVPVGSGLSSSAALEVSSALALLGERAMEPLELARLCQRAEREFVGMPCGIMDQFISIFGQENSALQIDCRSLDYRAVKLPENVEIAAVNTMVKHELGQSAYRERVAECAEAVRAIQQRHPEVASLREATLEQLELVDGVAHRRARHVITENQRVEAFVEASARADLAEMGRLFVASHRSLQHDYEVSCEELDFLVDTALGIPGVYGARMTGGGFGGCIVALFEPSAEARFADTLPAAYKERFALEPRIYLCRPSAGAGREA